MSNCRSRVAAQHCGSSSSSHASSSYSYQHSSSYSCSSSTSYSSSGSSTGRCGSAAACTDATGRCAVRFVPRENGVHQLHVRQNAVPVAGSPFSVMVGKHDSDPAKVGAYGDGLSKGRTRTYLVSCHSLTAAFLLSLCYHAASNLLLDITGNSSVSNSTPSAGLRKL